MLRCKKSSRPGGVARAALFVVLGAVVFALSAGTAAAAAPANDNFANATTLAATLPANESGTLAEATNEPGEADHTGFNLGGGRTVWFKWSPTADETVAVGTCGSPSYSAASVYSQGPVGDTGPRLGTYSGCLNGTSAIVHAQAGQTYFIGVEDVTLGDPGAFALKLEVAGSLAGRVLDGSSQPVNDHCVDVIDPATRTIVSTIHTGGDGRWSVELAPASYQVSFRGCTAGGDYAPEYWQNQADVDNAATIALAPGQAQTGVDATLEPASTIQGDLTGPGGSAVANACVTVYDSDHPDREVTETNTDLSGHYRVTNLSATSYKLLFTPGCTSGSELKNEYYDDKATFATANLVTLAVGQNRTGVDAALGDGGSISGTVRDASNAGIEDICVTATPDAGGGDGSTQTDASGHYTVTGLDPGSYTVTFTDCNTGTYATTTYPSSITLTREQDRIGVDVTMPENAIIKGRVTGPGGASEPLQNICVAAIDAGGNEAVSVDTDQNGDYELDGLAPGTYKIHFVDCADGDFVDEYFDDKATLATATAITVTAGQLLTGKDAQLASAGAIAGIVTGPGGAPLGGICASALNANGEEISLGASDPTDGHYVINHLVPGSYKVIFRDCSGGTFATEFYDDSATFPDAASVPVQEGLQTGNVDAQLADGGSISGSVTEEGNAPAPDVCVTAFSAADAIFPLLTVPTDSAGHYSLTGLRPGSYKVYFDGSCSADQLSEGFYDGAATFSEATPVSVTADADHGAVNVNLTATQPPTVTIDFGPSGPTADATPTFSFTRTGGGAVECSIDTGTANFGPCSNALAHTPASNLADGSYTFRVRVSNAAGEQTQTRAFSVDTTPPTVSVTGGPNGTTTNDQKPTFTFTSEAGASVQCSIDTGTSSYGPCSTATSHTPTSNLTDGSYTFRIRATDGVGNSAVATRTFTVDATPPTVSVTGGPNGTTTKDQQPTFTFTSEAGTSLQCSIDTGTPSYGACTTATSHTPATNLTDGNYTFRVRATDGATNTSTATRSFTVDATPPNTTINSGPSDGSTITTASATFAFTSSESGSTFECKLDSEDFAACPTPKTLTSLANGSHTFSVRAIDGATNSDPTPAARTFTVDTTDHTPPETSFTSGPADGSTITTGSTSFGFNSDEAGSTFECKLDSAGFGSCTSPRVLSGLTDGEHTFSVRATDPNGNTDPSPAVRTFTVAIDSTPPDTTIDSGPNGTIATNSGAFAFHSNETGGSFECKLDSAAYAPCTSPRSLSGLANGSHTFSVRAIDAAANVDPSPASRTFTVAVQTTTPPPPPPDDTGPCDAANAQLASAQKAMTKAKAKLKKAKSKAAKKKAKAAVKKAKKKVSAANQAVAEAC